MPTIKCVYTAVLDNTIKGDFSDETFMEYVFPEKNEDEDTKITVILFDSENRRMPFRKNMLEYPVTGMHEESRAEYSYGTTTVSFSKAKYKGKKNEITPAGIALIEANKVYEKL